MSNSGMPPVVAVPHDSAEFPWSFDTTLVACDRRQRKNLPRYGTVTRYRTVMSDDIERDVIYGQALDRLKPAARSVDLTMGTAPPLSLGNEGMVMHFLLKSLEMGIDAVIFGPERTRHDQPMSRDESREMARRISLPSSAHAAHAIADRLGESTGGDLSTMLWAGISLGSLKGILFGALAPARNRTMAYSHFVAPVCPNPMEPPTDEEYRRWMRSEMGAMARVSAELMWKDVRKRTFSVHPDVLRMVRPGLIARYARSMPRSRVFRPFTAEWRNAVASGVAGIGATWLPTSRLATFELFDGDEGAPAGEWQEKLAPHLAAGTTKIVINRGRHADSTRLSFQKRRARAIKSVISAIYAGVPVDELVHPLARQPATIRTTE